MEKIKIKIIGSDQRTQITIPLGINYVPLYSSERRVELPEYDYTMLEGYYNHKASGNREQRCIYLVIEHQGRKDMSVRACYTKEPQMKEALTPEEIELYGVAKFPNIEHNDWEGQVHISMPRFFKVDKINDDDVKYSLTKTFSKNEFLHKVTNWKFLIEYLFKAEYRKLEMRTVYATKFRIYTTNVIKALDYYNVYVQILKHDVTQEVFTETKDSLTTTIKNKIRSWKEK